MREMLEYYKGKFRSQEDIRQNGRKCGLELKFPVVGEGGEAAEDELVKKLWHYLVQCGWEEITDPFVKETVGVKRNADIVSTETGYCKLEVSLGPENNLTKLSNKLDSILKLLANFSEEYGAYFLGYGIQPKTMPSKRLYQRKQRSLFWERLFPSNRIIEKEEGCDVHLFTVNASSQVHVEVSSEEAVDALNIFNGLSGPQIALNAHSPIWGGRTDSRYKAVAEVFWDWWLPGENRTGMPEKKFKDMEDYLKTVTSLKPVFVVRNEEPLTLPQFSSFQRYFFSKGGSLGETVDGGKIYILPEKKDLDLHLTFVWYDARLSRYGTVENRLNCQQPPREMMVVGALTLGLVENLQKAKDLVSKYSWEKLKQARQDAMGRTLKAEIAGKPIFELCKDMVSLSGEGLVERGLGEEKYLQPLWQRLTNRKAPADEAIRYFLRGGVQCLLRNLSIQRKKI